MADDLDGKRKPRMIRLDQARQGCPGGWMAARAHGTWILEGKPGGVVGAGTLHIVTPARMVQPAGPDGGASAWGGMPVESLQLPGSKPVPAFLPRDAASTDRGPAGIGT
jgi:hypothetical protein